MIYMMVAYGLAVILAVIAYMATEQLAGIPMRLTAENTLITLVLAGVVGILSGLLSAAKLRGAEPADLF
jgi:hypothetical protein